MRDTTFDNTCQGGDGMEERRLPAVEAAQKSSPRVSTSALDSREGSRSYLMRSRSGFWRVPQHYPGDGLGPSPGTEREAYTLQGYSPVLGNRPPELRAASRQLRGQRCGRREQLARENDRPGGPRAPRAPFPELPR